MKTAFAFLAPLALVGAAMESQIRGRNEREYSTEIVDLAEQFRRDLGQKFNYYDDGAGCNCAKDSILDLTHAYVDALEQVPYVTLALLEEFTNNEGGNDDADDDDGDQIGELEFNPLELYEEVVCLVKALITYARQILVQIDCNYCGIDGTKTTTDPERRRVEKLDTITPYEDISHYECCCDVFAVRDLVISRMKDMFNKHLLNPGAEDFTDIALGNLYHSTIKAIKLLTDVYLMQHQAFEVEVPDISDCGVAIHTTTLP